MAGAQLVMCPPGTGDILGNALQNLDSLLAMPYGCGEQNMVRFAPNIYIQQYLEKTGQLLPDIRAKAQGFLQSGQWDPDSPPGRATTVPQRPPHATWLPWAQKECPVPMSSRRVPAGAAVQTPRWLLQRLWKERFHRQYLVRALHHIQGSSATQGAPVLTLSPPMSPWLQADSVCPQVLWAGPSLRGH